ncbi:MAG: hypothetical protein U0103_05750 [Candidatus Obscuribacterales bacterium]
MTKIARTAGHRAKILDTIGRHSAATADRKLAMERVNSDINRLPNNRTLTAKLKPMSSAPAIMKLKNSGQKH